MLTYVYLFIVKLSRSWCAYVWLCNNLSWFGKAKLFWKLSRLETSYESCSSKAWTREGWSSALRDTATIKLSVRIFNEVKKKLRCTWWQLILTCSGRRISRDVENVVGASSKANTQRGLRVTCTSRILFSSERWSTKISISIYESVTVDVAIKQNKQKRKRPKKGTCSRAVQRSVFAWRKVFVVICDRNEFVEWLGIKIRL